MDGRGLHPSPSAPGARPLALALLACSLAGCVLTRAARSNETLALIATLGGELRAEVPPGQAAFVVILRRGPGGWEVHSSRVTSLPGPFEFLAPAGEYRLFAFVDANGDLEWTEGEPSAQTSPRTLASGEAAVEPEMTVRRDGPRPPGPLKLSQPKVTEELVKVHRGDLASLGDERFGDAAATLAYWQPADFALRYGVGVSFLEPYDPQKVPVLFIHGAAGSPRNFAALIAAMDRSRFQPWVYSYPSGIRLELAATKLVHLTDDLRHRLKFERLLVVGHSMGGLVAKAYAAKVGGRRDLDYVRALVTIATPFDGHEEAAAGVRSSPVVLPSWRDMAVGSAFLLGLRAPLPGTTPHFLFFTYVGGARATGPTDGTVSVRSMLSADLQGSAARVLGFPEDHESILRSPELIGELNSALRLGAQAPGATTGPPVANH